MLELWLSATLLVDKVVVSSNLSVASAPWSAARAGLTNRGGFIQ